MGTEPKLVTGIQRPSDLRRIPSGNLQFDNLRAVVFAGDMSKKSPSIAQALAPVRSTLSLRPWTRRVFHNSYTYAGNRRRVRRWAVKIQFQRKRRTFSLAARTRAGAAQEAKKIYDRLRAGGWEVVSQLAGRDSAGGCSPNDVRYWKRRLRLRNSGSNNDIQYSARIDHEGTGAFFPLHPSDADQAAACAVTIHHRLLRDGWTSVRSSFPYEFTLGFRWVANPLLWTYSTLRSRLDQPAPSGRAGLPRKPVVLIEPRLEVRNAVTHFIQQAYGIETIGFDTPAQWEASPSCSSFSLGLVNMECADRLFPVGPPQLLGLPHGFCMVPYSIHIDSDDLFLAAPGGLTGYCFKRLGSEELLRPIAGELGNAAPQKALVSSVQTFFQSVTKIPAEAPINSRQQASFTRRETEVVALLTKGCVDKEIARVLGISVWTVHEHVKRVFEKLGVHSRIEATLAYLQK